MEIPDPVKDVLFRVANHGHRFVRAVTGGRIGNEVAGMPVVELHTTGRRSGERRTSMLTLPLPEADGELVLVASKGGDDRHPAWYLNLVANSDVEVTVGGTTRPMRARVATAEETAELWPRIVAAAPQYGGYERKTGRDIPVIICGPR